MKIKLTNEIESVCGRFILPVNCELDVTDTDEQRQVYEVNFGLGYFEVPFQCAEAIVEPLPVDESYPSKIRVIRDLPEFGGLDIKKGDTFRPIRTTDEFYFVSTLSTLIQIPIDAAEVIERRTVLQDFGLANPNEFTVEQETSTGGSSKYYDLIINGQAVKVEDIVKDVFGNDFDYGNAFKALVRSFALRSGGGKAGSTVDYECEKIKYYAGRIQKQ